MATALTGALDDATLALCLRTQKFEAPYMFRGNHGWVSEFLSNHLEIMRVFEWENPKMNALVFKTSFCLDRIQLVAYEFFNWVQLLKLGYFSLRNTSNGFQKIFDIDFIFTIGKIWTQFEFTNVYMSYKLCINLDWCQCFATITLARWKSSLYYLSVSMSVSHVPFNTLSTNWLLLCWERNYVSIFIIKHRNNDNCAIHKQTTTRRWKKYCNNRTAIVYGCRW